MSRSVMRSGPEDPHRLCAMSRPEARPPRSAPPDWYIHHESRTRPACGARGKPVLDRARLSIVASDGPDTPDSPCNDASHTLVTGGICLWRVPTDIAG